jgi:ClpP class serine protease
MTTRAFAAVLAQPWAIDPSWLPLIAALAQRAHDAPEVIAAREARPLNGARRATMRDGVAVLPLHGPIFPRANVLTETSGATSLQMLASDLQKALDDPQVRAVLLDIDSPGGAVSGVNEFAGMVRAARAVKPVAAYVGGAGTSAAYWIASAASPLVVEPTAMLGSIGVVAGAEYQEAPDPRGYRQVEIVSSNAVDKHPDGAREGGRATIRAVLDRIEAEFVDAVARHRNVTRGAVLSDFGRGGVKVGADAVAAGMADRVGSFEQILAELAAAGPAVNVIARAAAGIGGAAAERTRLAAIEAVALPGPDKLVAAAKADGAMTAPVAAAVAAAADAALPLEQRAKAAWARDPKLRAEFLCFDHYLAFAKAEAAGRVKTYGGRVVGR